MRSVPLAFIDECEVAANGLRAAILRTLEGIVVAVTEELALLLLVAVAVVVVVAERVGLTVADSTRVPEERKRQTGRVSERERYTERQTVCV